MMGLFDRLFPPKPSIDHPVFGKISLLRGKNGPYWIHESFSDDEPTISIETKAAEPPSEQQVAFYRRFAGNQDAAFARVAERLAPRYENLLKRSFPENWREAFALAGLGIPYDGNERLPWEMSFQLLTDNKGFLFTCYFENGALVNVGMDT
jgi:hypothetical protein